jgi:2-(1,2-epoxy-1,2-dihydrophenyl)acetyl-CoA isomerase
VLGGTVAPLAIMATVIGGAMSEMLEVEREERLLVLRLNRPERKNALTSALLRDLVEAVRGAARDDSVWAIGVTGTGDAFSSGLDLADSGGDETTTSSSSSEEDVAPDPGTDNFAHAMRLECEKPVIAGVNGIAVGIGLSLAMAADMRIASASARFHPGYARVGISPDGGLTWTLPQAIGYERAMRFLLEQRMIDAEEALAMGMVGEIADEGAFEARFLDYCRQMAEVAPIAARQTKRMLGRIGTPSDLAAHLREEVRLALYGLSTDDSKEAVRAVMARERPTFTGR